MKGFYRFFGMLRTVFAIMLLIATPALAAQDPAFVITGVKVDVTAEDATAARDQAFIQAQQAAFRQLAERMIPEDDLTSFKMPDDSTLSTFVNDFEVTQEQLSHIQYIGTYTFRFKSDAVRSYLSGSGVSYTDVSSKPVLVLPYYEWGTRMILWGRDNPWLGAWTRAERQQGLVPLTVPIGDLQDVADMGDSDALTYDEQSLYRMVNRYGAGEAVIVIATPVWAADTAETQLPAEIRIAMYRTDRGKPERSGEVNIASEKTDSAAALLDRTVQAVQKILQKDWKSRTLVSASQSNNLQVRVKFVTMQEWVDTQQKLRRVQGVSEVRLLSLKPGQAHVELLFQGSEDRLRLALAQADMTLTAPQVSFIDYTSDNAASPYEPRPASPLVYDLYLNKYATGQ